jgi:hypothetical protein
MRGRLVETFRDSGYFSPATQQLIGLPARHAAPGVVG